MSTVRCVIPGGRHGTGRTGARCSLAAHAAHGWPPMHDVKRCSFFYSWRKIAVVFPAHIPLSRRQRDYPRGNKIETRESSIFPSDNLVDDTN